MKFDVFSFGMVSTSKLILLEGDYPKPDLYSEVKEQYIMTGGEAANSSIVLSKLGIKVKLDGNWLGNNSEEMETIKILNQYNIDTKNISIFDNYKGPTETVIASGNQRTIFGTYGKFYEGKRIWNTPKEVDIINSKFVCLDPFFGEESKKVSRLCLKHEKPYITVDCRHDDEIAINAEVVIISTEFRNHQYSSMSLEETYKLYKKNCNGLLILTCGEQQLLYSRKNSELSKFSTYKVKVVDTAGAGDSFRSGIIYGLLQGWDDYKTIQFAAALSALVCTSFPGVLKSPTKENIIDLIRMHDQKFEII